MGDNEQTQRHQERETEEQEEEEQAQANADGNVSHTVSASTHACPPLLLLSTTLPATNINLPHGQGLLVSVHGENGGQGTYHTQQRRRG